MAPCFFFVCGFVGTKVVGNDENDTDGTDDDEEEEKYPPSSSSSSLTVYFSVVNIVLSSS